MQKMNFKNFKYAVGENKSGAKKICKGGENKYEINTNLPLARVRRLKSDVHDFSPMFMPKHPL